MEPLMAYACFNFPVKFTMVSVTYKCFTMVLPGLTWITSGEWTASPGASVTPCWVWSCSCACLAGVPEESAPMEALLFLTSAIPHFGHLPGFVSVTSGCIGHV